MNDLNTTAVLIAVLAGISLSAGQRSEAESQATQMPGGAINAESQEQEERNERSCPPSACAWIDQVDCSFRPSTMSCQAARGCKC